MKLYTLTGQSTYVNNTVKKPTQKIFVRLTFGLLAGETDNTLAIIRGLSMSQQNSYFATIYRQSKNGQKTICKKMPLYHLFEIAKGKEGFIRFNADPTTANGPVQMMGYIDLSHDGTIPFSDTDYLQIDIEQANTQDTIELYTKTTEDNAVTYLKYDYLKTGAGQTPTTINTGSYEYLFLTKPNLATAQITYDNNLTDEFSPEELEADNDEMNEVVQLRCTDLVNPQTFSPVYGSDQLWQVPLTNLAGGKVVQTTELNTTGNSAYPYVLMKSVKL
jgi:hypothetical protein